MCKADNKGDFERFVDIFRHFTAFLSSNFSNLGPIVIVILIFVIGKRGSMRYLAQIAAYNKAFFRLFGRY